MNRKIAHWRRLYSVTVDRNIHSGEWFCELGDKRRGFASCKGGPFGWHLPSRKAAETWGLWLVAERERRRVVGAGRRWELEVTSAGRAAIQKRPRRVVSWERAYDIDRFESMGRPYVAVYDWNQELLGTYRANMIAYPPSGNRAWSETALLNAALLVIAQREHSLGVYRRSLGVAS